MLHDQEVAYDWIAAEARNPRGWNPKPMPFPLEKFRNIRAGLVFAGLIKKTATGRYVPA